MTLSARQTMFIDEFIVSGNSAAAARASGYSVRSAKQLGSRLTNVVLKAEIAAKRAEIANKIELKKEHVVAGIFDGIATARRNGDAGNIIRGFLALAMLTGVDKPEVASRVLTTESEALRAKFESLSDDELLEIAAKQ